jgi:hypothetical protein
MQETVVPCAVPGSKSIEQILFLIRAAIDRALNVG